MSEVAIVGVDLAKRVFQVHGAAANGEVLFRKRLTRSQFVSFYKRLAPADHRRDGGHSLGGEEGSFGRHLAWPDAG